MKIIHTADWHLGQTFYNYNRYKEHAVFLDWLCCTIKERGTDVLLIAGDVFDNPNPSAEAQKMYYNFLRRVTGENEDLKIVIIAGNHDSAARIEAPSPLLDIFNVHVSGVLHYVDGKRDYDRMIVPLNSNTCCLAVPYLRYSDLSDSENYSKGVADFYAELYRRAKEKGYSTIIAMGHLQASGAEVSAGDHCEHATIGGMEGIDACFSDFGFAYTALGHLHKAQNVAHKENIRYSGSPLPMSFAEENYRHSVTEAIIDENGCSVKKIPFQAPVALICIPTTPQAIDIVLTELEKLPDGEADDTSPFLRIKVLVQYVDPNIRQQIETILEKKAVRLANIDTVSTLKENGTEECTMTFDEFRKMKPLDLMEEIYKRKNEEEMSEELKVLLMEVMEEVKE